MKKEIYLITFPTKNNALPTHWFYHSCLATALPAELDPQPKTNRPSDVQPEYRCPINGV